MPISKTTAQEICTKPEFAIVEPSYTKETKGLTLAKLRLKLASAKKMHASIKDRLKKQEREMAGKNKTGKKTPPAAVQGTGKKLQLFTETIERYEKLSVKLAKPMKAVKAPAKKIVVKVPAKKAKPAPKKTIVKAVIKKIKPAVKKPAGKVAAKAKPKKVAAPAKKVTKPTKKTAPAKTKSPAKKAVKTPAKAKRSSK